MTHVAVFAINIIYYSFFLPHAHMLDHMYSIWSCLTACDYGQSYRWPVLHSLSVALASIWVSCELALWTAEFLFRSGTHLSAYRWLGFSLSTIPSEHFTSQLLSSKPVKMCFWWLSGSTLHCIQCWIQMDKYRQSCYRKEISKLVSKEITLTCVRRWDLCWTELVWSNSSLIGWIMFEFIGCQKLNIILENGTLLSHQIVFGFL